MYRVGLEDRRSGRSRRLMVASLAAALLLAMPAAGLRAEEADADLASFRFTEARTQSVLSALEQLYGLRFRADAELPERLSVDSRGLVGVDEMLALLDSALRPSGAVVRRDGDLVRIVPMSLAAARVELVQLQHADPTEVAQIVNTLFQTPDLLRETTSENAELVARLVAQLNRHGSGLVAGQMRVTAVAYPRTRSVVIRAPEASLGAIRQFVLDDLDRPTPQRVKTPEEIRLEEQLRERQQELQRLQAAERQRQEELARLPEEVKIYRLNHVPAAYVAAAAQRLEGVHPTVEERINAVIHRTRDASEFEKLERVIALLDVPDASTAETYHVTLNNATANDVRNTLSQLYRRTLRLPFTPEGLEAVGPQPGSEAIDEAAEVLVSAGVEEATAREFVVGSLGMPMGDVEIIADPNNNALLIQTHPRNIDGILRVIQELDRPRRQVMIKVFIAQVTLDDTIESGVDFIYNRSNDIQRTYRMRFDVSPTAPGLTYTYISENIEAFIRALQASSRLDVISRPQVLTLDNQPAVIEFGKRVPLVQTTQITSTGVVNSTVRYEDVVTRLQVTPHINAAGFIRLDIRQTIDDVSPDTFAITERLAPRILVTRRAQTQAQVRDGQTVCLGGFIGDTIEESEQKLPILGDIPLIGRAFSASKRTRVKSEMLIFITPYILETPEELLSMTNRVRSQSVTTRRADRPTQELEIQGAPDRNPHRGWQRSHHHYTIPRREPAGQDAPQPNPAAPLPVAPEAVQDPRRQTPHE